MKKIKTTIGVLTILFFMVNMKAQVGIGTTLPEGALDITSSTDGLVIPRIALVNTTTVTVITGTTAELVYNTATVNDVTPGFYYLSTATGPWIRIATAITGWLTTGNTGIIDGTNYIGTAASTNVDVAFRRNNLAAGKIGTTSTSFGVGALTNGAGSNSTAIGNNALSVSTGSNNVAIGQDALRNLVTTAQWNTAVGASALGRINTATAQYNTAVGFEAMFAQTGSISNTTAIGYHALFQNAGNSNTALGFQALQGNLTAIGNTAVGGYSLNNNATGANNTAAGFEAGFSATTAANNTLIGFQAGKNNSNASNNNTFLGYQAGIGSTGANNIAIGSIALASSGGSNCVAIGVNSLNANTGVNNTAIGYNSLKSNISGTGNVAIGYQAGFSETASNKLYISNSSTSPTTSLVYGEFSPIPLLRTNSTFQIGDPSGTGYVFPTTRGVINQYLASDASGVLSWASPNGTNSLSAVRTNLASNQLLSTVGWQIINFTNVIIDANLEFSSNRFVANKAGIYQINAGFHTDNQNNNQFYSIGVYVNGTLYQQTSGNHNGLGTVSRNINCIASLTSGGYVEIFVENYQNSVAIDSFSGKTFFEITQIK